MNKLNPEQTDLINNHPFAQILSVNENTTNTNGEFATLSFCPLQLSHNSQLLGHLSQYNPLINAVKNNSRVKVIFTGPQGYISPRWHNEQIVPTWNYATVSLICQLTFIENNTDKLKAMADISQHFDPQWDFNEFSQEKNHKVVQQMLSAITVFQLTIIEVDSKFKLSQNRSMECRRAFEKNLRLVDNNSLADIQI